MIIDEQALLDDLIALIETGFPKNTEDSFKEGYLLALDQAIEAVHDNVEKGD